MQTIPLEILLVLKMKEMTKKKAIEKKDLVILQDIIKLMITR